MPSRAPFSFKNSEELNLDEELNPDKGFDSFMKKILIAGVTASLMFAIAAVIASVALLRHWW